MFLEFGVETRSMPKIQDDLLENDFVSEDDLLEEIVHTLTLTKMNNDLYRFYYKLITWFLLVNILPFVIVLTFLILVYKYIRNNNVDLKEIKVRKIAIYLMIFIIFSIFFSVFQSCCFN